MYGKLHAGVCIDPRGPVAGRECVYIYQESEVPGAAPCNLRYFPDTEEVGKLIDDLSEARRKVIVNAAYREAAERGASQLAHDLAEVIGRGSLLVADALGLELSESDLAYIRERVAWYVATDSAVPTMGEIAERVPYMQDEEEEAHAIHKLTMGRPRGRGAA